MQKLSFPKQDGFFMPAEFAPHAGTFMIWPERPGSWIYGAETAREAFADVIRAITGGGERVYLAVSGTSSPSAKEMLKKEMESGLVVLWEIPTDDAWARDTGPTFVTDGARLRGIDWKFNAWGGDFDGLYADYAQDDRLAGEVCRRLCVPCYDAHPFVLEGGSVHTDGEGTLLVTEECLLSPGRNPEMSREAIEEKLRAYLSVEKIIWLPYGIDGDETNGHVDNICAFTAPGEVVLAWTDDTGDPQNAKSLADYEVLAGTTDARGRKLKIRKLPLPQNPVTVTEWEAAGYVYEPGEAERVPGERLAASYANFYVAGERVVVPQFGDPNDAVAVKILQEAFPGRTVVPVNTRAIIVGGGNIHCITQQIPGGGPI
mgnify:FL=1